MKPSVRIGSDVSTVKNSQVGLRRVSVWVLEAASKKINYFTCTSPRELTPPTKLKNRCSPQALSPALSQGEREISLPLGGIKGGPATTFSLVFWRQRQH